MIRRLLRALLALSLIVLVILTLAVPTFAQGDSDCTVTAIGGAVLRSGPDTSFETAGALGAGESRAVTRSQDDLGGQTWWRLSSGAWVREDLVTESPGCESLGEMAGDTGDAAAPEGECVVTALDGAVLRSGAGTAFETAGSLGAGESRNVIRSQDDLGGQTWWRLSSGAWVREDLVSESPGCATLGAEMEEAMVETDAAADECVVTSIDAAVLRSGPGITFENAGALVAGESRDVTRSQDDLGGQTWWRLSGGAWVREDLVSESAGCDTLGEVAETVDIGVSDAVGDECVVTALDGAVLRSGPGTSFESAGALGAGESRNVIRQQDDLGGQTWWRLSNGDWVREDLVSESAGCDTLGAEMEEEMVETGSTDECVVTAINGAVLRSGAGIAFETAGALGAGESRTVIRSQVDLGGQTWWRLSGGAWVREDLVNESPGCDTLGEEDGGSETSAAADKCVVTAIDGAVLRRGPDTSFETAGALGAGESRAVIRSQDDLGGQTWWRLSNGAWVREDLVNESPGCDTLG